MKNIDAKEKDGFDEIICSELDYKSSMIDISKKN